MLPLNDSKDLYSAFKKVNQNFKDAAYDEPLFNEPLFNKVVKGVFDGLAKDSSLLSNDEALVGEWKKLSSHAAKYLDLPFDSKVCQRIKYINACISTQSFFPGTACDLCEDMAQPIFACIARLGDNLSAPISRSLSPLACVSKKWNYSLNKLQILHAIEHNIEHKEINEQKQRFLDTKFDTAEEAIDFIVKEQLKIAPLRAFQNLTYELLDKLLQENVNLKHLIVYEAGNITQLPKECSQLETLSCIGLPLTSLPDMPNLISLDCGNCYELTSLLDMSLLMSLNCMESGVKSLPKYLPYLKSLDCSYGPIASLPDMSRLKSLNCSGSKITSLPASLKQLVSLDCEGCEFLESLSECLTQLTSFKCSWCEQLTSLPENLAHLTKLDCSSCHTLKSLPKSLMQLTELDCSSCHSLESLPESLTQLTELDCSSCHSLESLPKSLTQLTKLNCSSCPKLTSLPKSLTPLTELVCRYLDFSSLDGFLNPEIFKNVPTFLKSFTEFEISFLPSKSLGGFIKPETLKSLKHLDCSYSSRLMRLPSMPNLVKLTGFGCPNLKIQAGDLPEGCEIRGVGF